MELIIITLSQISSLRQYSTVAAMSDLIPDHILTNILSRLPSISLSRFKTVCKSWYSLISDPYFITLHSKRASQNPKLFVAKQGLQFHLVDFESSCFDESCLSAPLDFPMATPTNNYNFLKFLGSCCGLVCVAIGHLQDNRRPFNRRPFHCSYNIFLWNPSTKEFRKVPDLSPPIIDESWGMVFRAHGLGYDPVSNDFKLVVADESRTTYNVFSMKLNSWKSVSNLYSNSRLFLNDTQAVVLNGVFHWLIYPDLASSSNTEVIAFDSKEDKFLNVQIPQVSSFEKAFLFEHKRCLCISFTVVHEPPEKVEEEIWMLKENVWIHLLGISSKSLQGGGFQPICMSDSNSTQVILRSRCQRAIIRSTKEDEEFTALPTTTPLMGAIMYAESLVSTNHIQIIDN